MPEAQSPLALIIDDEEDLRQLARLALRVDGWRVEVAVNGREGFDLARKLQPDLVLVDLMMPSMSGVELCRRLVEDLQMWNVPVLMISAVNEKAKILDDFWNLPLRFRGFLGKPFDMNELVKAVREVSPPERRGKKQAGPKPSAPLPRPGIAPAQAETVLRPTPSPKPAAPKPVPPEAQETRVAPPPPPPPIAAAPNSPPPPKKVSPEPPKPPKPSVPPAPKPESEPPPPAKSPAQLAAESADKAYRILIMDDEEDIRMILEMGLGRRWTVQTAVNGMDGLRKLDEFQPDFILSDINMPVMNGLETAEAIRRHPRFSEVPIFFLTAEADTNLPRRAFELGANLFLKKPVDVVRVGKCIEYFLKEAAVQPGRYLAQSLREKEEKRAQMAAAIPRTLLIDFNIENHRLLKRLLGDMGQPGTVPGGPLETFWVEDPRTALGNLSRWEPDLILYNPRNPNLDGITFGQTLRLNKELDKTTVALIGTRFYDADIRYSEQTFKRPVIQLEAPESEVIQLLARAIAGVKTHLRPKQFSWKQLHAEEVERLRLLQQSDAKKARERDMLKKRYQSVQEFIDRQVS